MSFCHKLELSNPYIFATGWRKPLIFQTYMFWANRNHSLKYLRSTTLDCKNIGIRKSKFVGKTQFLYKDNKVKGSRWVLLRPNLNNFSRGLVSHKNVFKVSRFKQALNWNRVFADLRHGSNSLNSDSDIFIFLILI